METIKNIKNNLFNTQVGVASVAFGVAIIICAILLANGIGNIKRANNTIRVTGSTEKIVKSDKAKLSLSINRKAGVSSGDIVAQNRLLMLDSQKVKQYLLDKGFKEDTINVSTVEDVTRCAINTKHGYPDCDTGVLGHDLTLDIDVSSKEIDKILELSKGIATGIGAYNIDVSLKGVEYYYDKLKDERVGMLAEATRNATERASAIASAGNGKLGSIVEASSGVFQVTTVNSVDVSDDGRYDTSTVDKKVTAVVRVSFEVK